jgi:hypothetical protein
MLLLSVRLPLLQLCVQVLLLLLLIVQLQLLLKPLCSTASSRPAVDYTNSGTLLNWHRCATCSHYHQVYEKCCCSQSAVLLELVLYHTGA